MAMAMPKSSGGRESRIRNAEKCRLQTDRKDLGGEIVDTETYERMKLVQQLTLAQLRLAELRREQRALIDVAQQEVDMYQHLLTKWDTAHS